MSLLSIQEIKVRLQNFKYLVPQNTLNYRIEETHKITYKLFDIIKKLDYNLLVNDSNILWQIGHLCFFYLNLIFPNLLDTWPGIIQNNFLTSINLTLIEYNKLVDFYNSFITPSHLRNNENYIIKLDEIIKIYEKLFEIINQYLEKHNTNYINSYLIMLGILHQHMHLEAMIFHLLKNKIKLDFINFNYSNTSNQKLIINNIEWISYPSGNFIQGSTNYQNNLVFDNEKPSFQTHISEFKVSKYHITEYQYTQFILAGGYNNPEYWNDVSWDWKIKNNINLPLYWEEINQNKLDNNKLDNQNKLEQKLVIKRNGKYYSTHTNLPICHISYYEALAFCKWKKVRLPMEKEYEYLATNRGTTKYPWGNDSNLSKYSNINYQNYIIPVNEIKEGDNKLKVSQLIGNVWEWCQEPIYPYDNFSIDPVYREMSYPFFGHKRICKGGCWAVPDYLIHPQYRNAQPPTCREQFIGFRVCI